MKTRTNHSLPLHLLWVMTVFSTAFVSAQGGQTIDTNIYSIDLTAPSDDRGTMDGRTEMGWYGAYVHYNRDLRAMGLALPVPEQLPAWRDTNGNWGAPADGLQLSLRFHRKEFLRAEAVQAMVVLRNLASVPRTVVFRGNGISEARKNFAFMLHGGTNTVRWGWTDPKRSEWARFVHDWKGQTMKPHSQMSFFLRLDQIFDLTQLGQYAVQATWTNRHADGMPWTNAASGTVTQMSSGTATFRVVDKLSPGEIAATNAWGRGLKELERQWSQAQRSSWQQYYETNAGARARLYSVTNQPSKK